MPIYDVRCTLCGYEDTKSLKLSELTAWDQESRCPSCAQGASAYRRIIKVAAARVGSAMPNKKLSLADKDSMRHKGVQRRNPDDIAASIENVRKGAFEGF